MARKAAWRKKASLAVALSDIWSYIFFVFVAILFFTLFSVENRDVSEHSILGSEVDSSSDLLFLNYLRAPIQVELDSGLKPSSIAELIVLYHLDDSFITGDFQRIIKEQSEEIFAPFDNVGWRVIVSDDEAYPKGRSIAEGQTEYNWRNQERSILKRISRSCIQLPSLDPEKIIKAELVLVDLRDLNENARERDKYQSNKYRELSC